MKNETIALYNIKKTSKFCHRLKTTVLEELSILAVTCQRQKVVNSFLEANRTRTCHRLLVCGICMSNCAKALFRPQEECTEVRSGAISLNPPLPATWLYYALFVGCAGLGHPTNKPSVCKKKYIVQDVLYLGVAKADNGMELNWSTHWIPEWPQKMLSSSLLLEKKFTCTLVKTPQTTKTPHTTHDNNVF